MGERESGLKRVLFPSVRFANLVPTLCVGMQSSTLRVGGPDGPRSGRDGIPTQGMETRLNKSIIYVHLCSSVANARISFTDSSARGEPLAADEAAGEVDLEAEARERGQDEPAPELAAAAPVGGEDAGVEPGRVRLERQGPA